MFSAAIASRTAVTLVLSHLTASTLAAPARGPDSDLLLRDSIVTWFSDKESAVVTTSTFFTGQAYNKLATSTITRMTIVQVPVKTTTVPDALLAAGTQLATRA